MAGKTVVVLGGGVGGLVTPNELRVKHLSCSPFIIESVFRTQMGVDRTGPACETVEVP